jgi:hypothetical protein
MRYKYFHVPLTLISIYLAVWVFAYARMRSIEITGPRCAAAIFAVWLEPSEHRALRSNSGERQSVRKRARDESDGARPDHSRGRFVPKVCECGSTHYFTTLYCPNKTVVASLARATSREGRVCNSSPTRSFDRGHDEDKLAYIPTDLCVQIIALNDCNKLVKSCDEWAVARNQHPRRDDFRRSRLLGAKIFIYSLRVHEIFEVSCAVTPRGK